MRPREQQGNQYELLGFSLSTVGHGIIVFFLVYFPEIWKYELEEPPVYTVTIEGGKSIGGRDQLAKTDKKTKVEAPKNVQEEEQKNQKQEVPTAPPIENKKPEEVKQEIKEESKQDDKGVNTVPEPIKATPSPKPSAEPSKSPAPPKEDPTKKPSPTTPPENQQKKESKSQNKKTDEPKIDVNKELQKSMQRYLGNSVQAKGEGFGAAKLGGNDMGGGVVKPREFFLYMTTIKERVKSGWSWPYNDGLIATVEMYIDERGNISSPRIVRSSGNSQFDDSLIRAIYQANPLPPPPSNVYQDFRHVRLVFDPRD
jgi:colicin import membrane protein